MWPLADQINVAVSILYKNNFLPYLLKLSLCPDSPLAHALTQSSSITSESIFRTFVNAMVDKQPPAI